MGQMKHLAARWAVLLAAAVGLGVLGYGTLCVVSSVRQGYSWPEMDWSLKGSTTLGDFLAAADIGKREVLKDGKKCAEYFSYKDGLVVKTVCPGA